MLFVSSNHFNTPPRRRAESAKSGASTARGTKFFAVDASHRHWVSASLFLHTCLLTYLAVLLSGCGRSGLGHLNDTE
jgi:hypothetical protein